MKILMDYFNTGFTEKSYFNLCKQIILRIYEDRTGKDCISFKFCNERMINAWTSLLDNGKDRLVINTGMITDIFSLMKTAFSQTDIFENIGDSKKENNIIIDGYFNEKDFSIRFSGTPNDQLREEISTYAALFALRFVLTHELGHILNGHTAYLKKIYMNSQIGMREEKRVATNEYCLDRRTMEMDADAAAASASFDNVAMLYHEHFNEVPINYLKRKEEIFEIWAFSICSIFMLFESMATTNYDENGYYLPNKARFFMVMSAAYEAAKSYTKHNIVPELKDKQEVIFKEVYRGVSEAEYLFLKKKIKFSWKKEFIERDNTYFNFSKEVLNNWDNKLKNKLEKYARAPLYDKDNIDVIMEQIRNS